MNAQAIPVLEPVVRTLANSSRTYAAAADRAGWDHLEQAFREIAERRERFADRLRAVIDSDEARSGSLQGTLRKWWLAIRDELSEDQYGLLAELERSEDALLERYERTLEGPDVPAPLARILHEQLAEIRGTHAKIRELRDSEKAARQA